MHSRVPAARRSLRTPNSGVRRRWRSHDGVSTSRPQRASRSACSRSGRGCRSATSSTSTLAAECLDAARQAGVNFFDNAESYAGGKSETDHGPGDREARLGAPRLRHVDQGASGVCTTSRTCKNTLNRKYLMQAIDGSLERFGLDFVDLIFCHRADPETPIEETVWAMSRHRRERQGATTGARRSGPRTRSARRGTSPTSHHLHKPVMEQPQYNLLQRRQRRVRVRASLRRHRARAHDLEPARARVCSPGSTSTACPTTAAPTSPATSG